LTGGVSAARSYQRFVGADLQVRPRTAACLCLAYDALCSLPLAVWFSFAFSASRARFSILKRVKKIPASTIELRKAIVSNELVLTCP